MTQKKWFWLACCGSYIFYLNCCRHTPIFASSIWNIRVISSIQESWTINEYRLTSVPMFGHMMSAIKKKHYHNKLDGCFKASGTHPDGRCLNCSPTFWISVCFRIGYPRKTILSAEDTIKYKSHSYVPTLPKSGSICQVPSLTLITKYPISKQKKWILLAYVFSPSEWKAATAPGDQQRRPLRVADSSKGALTSAWPVGFEKMFDLSICHIPCSWYSDVFSMLRDL